MSYYHPMKRENKYKSQHKSIVKWCSQGAPLLPESLRTAWSTEKLPLWLSAELGLPQEATLASLDENALGKIRNPSSRVRNYLTWLVRSRRSQIKSMPVITRPIPVELNLTRLPWAVRTRNCLNYAGLLEDNQRLGGVTYEDLFNIAAMGGSSILDFACTLETAMRSYYDIEQNATRIPEDVFPAINEYWAEQVSEQDPRFAHLFPGGEGTIPDRLDLFTSAPLLAGQLDKPQLIAAIQEARNLVHKLEKLPLESLLRQYFSSLSGETGSRLDSLLARFGWGGMPPITLEEAGLKLGVTRQRVQQLEIKIRGGFPSHPVVMPALDKALELLQKRTPLQTSEASRLLVKAGLASNPFHPASVLAAAQDCGRSPSFALEIIRGNEMVVPAEMEGMAGPLAGIARRQAGASGASNVLEVLSEAEQKGIKVELAQVRYVLQHNPDIQFLVEDWFWAPFGKVARNRLRNVTRKMLSVASPIHVSSLRDGIRRTYRWRNSSRIRSWELIAPPKNVLEAFYRAHPEFIVDETGSVRSQEVLDYQRELGQVEQVIVNVLRSSPACMLDRETLFSACHKRGINDNTLSVYTTYSPVVEHLGIDLWTLRGVRVDPAAVEALRTANLQRPREKRLMDHGWTSRGTLWIASRLPASLSGYILYVPAAIRRLLVSGDYESQSDSGAPCGTVKISDSGTTWGYAPYLSQHGADEGDILIVEFDLLTKKATLRLGDDELLQEYAPD